MKNLAKVVQIALADHKNWRHELTKFLRAYRATPHSMTGVPPASLMFNGRRYGTNLPSIQPKAGHSDLQTQAHTKDQQKKAKMKENADERGNVQTPDMRPGDKVLLKQKKQNKLTTAYETLPYTVQHVKGSQVTASNDLHQLTRHVNCYKKLPPMTADLDLAPERAAAPSGGLTTTSSGATPNVSASPESMGELASSPDNSGSTATATHSDDLPSQQVPSDANRNSGGVMAPLRRSERTKLQPARYPDPDRPPAL
jgi:hypothetical protein